MNTDPAPLESRVQQAWLLRFRDPQALADAGAAILAAAAGDPLAAGWGHLHRAWGLRFRAELPAAASSLAEAESCFRQAGDRAGLAACRVLTAYGGWLAGELEQALALLALDPLHPGSGRHPLERQIAINTRASLCEDRLASRPTGINSNAPAEWLRTHQAAAVACEALGDLAATVHHQREDQRLYEDLVGRSARAKRLTLEIEFDLERERRERDEAERRRAAAEAERARVDALNHALEAASLAKSRFLAAASHDLRQPVHALRRGQRAAHRRHERGRLIGRTQQVAECDRQVASPACTADAADRAAFGGCRCERVRVFPTAARLAR